MKKNRNPQIICISSGKGGVGKTSFTINLAAALSDKSRQVLLIDGDLGLANVDVMLGLNVQHNLRETVEEGRNPLEILVEIMPGFFVLPASSGVPEMASLSYEEQAFLTDSLERIIGNFDFVLVDTAAGIGESVLWFNDWADKNITILSPDPTAMTDAYALIKILKTRYNKKDFHLIINNVKNKKEGQEVFTNMSTVLENFLGVIPNYQGAIPQDSAVSMAVRRQKPFLTDQPKSRASMAVREICNKILS
ncbi:MAG: MinD/ParA family protein [Deltaproteobacteria bacterium]|nr:MinD/ParA family protein [Deltaproteobacteria bacterium]